MMTILSLSSLLLAFLAVTSCQRSSAYQVAGARTGGQRLTTHLGLTPRQFSGLFSLGCFSAKKGGFSTRTEAHPLFSSSTSTSSLDGKDGDGGKQSSKRSMLARLFVGILTLTAGYKWGYSKAAVESATASGIAGKAVKLASSTFETSSSAATTVSAPQTRSWKVLVLSSVLAMVLIRDIWHAIPQWARPGIVDRVVQDTKKVFGIASNVEDEGSDDQVSASGADSNNISNFATMASKFRKVQQIADRRVEMEEDFNWRACMLSLVRLLQQHKRANAVSRDERYASCGPPATLDKDLAEWMDLADAAYNELPEDTTLAEYLDERGFELIKHDQTVMPGYLGHYVALHKTEKTALIGVKGTSNLEDMITDMLGSAETHELSDGPFIEGGPTEIRAHDGVLLSSNRLADDLQPVVEKLLLPQDYKIVVVGHSLGAAAASLLAVLLQSRLPELRPKSEENKKLQVYAFASPPTLDLQSAKACKPFVKTIVNNCDAVTRSNAGPVLVSIEILKEVNKRLLDNENSEKKKVSRLSSLKVAWDFFWTSRSKEKKDEEKPIMTCDEFNDTIERALEKVGKKEDDPDLLYVPGEVLLMYDLWEEESEYQRQRTARNNDSEEEEEYDYSADRVIVTDPDAKILRYLEFDGRMMEDHMAPSYKDSLRALTGYNATTDAGISIPSSKLEMISEKESGATLT